MTALLDQKLVRSPSVVGRRVAGEFILVPIVSRGVDASAIYSLNAVGTFIWERLDGATAGHVLVEALVEAFEVDPSRAREDYEHFVGQLSSLGAIHGAEEPR
jgi:hypothetical protein